MSSVIVLPIDFQMAEMGESSFTVYPVILKDDSELILVDCGYPNFMAKIEGAMNKLNMSLAQLTKIIITHHDHDHMGALSEIKERYPSVEILCSKEETPYITGKSKSLRLLQAETIQDSLPEGEKEGGKAFQDFIASIKSVDNVTEINCGDTFSWCGGVDVVDTKGHMPGHISLYVRNEKTLIAGDALVVENGKLCMAMPQFLLNAQDAQDSVKRLMRYDIEKIICYHGGVYTTDVRNSLAEVIDGFGK
ncbi:MBL fold metallo-hydrolase [Oscillospiraceae bacterium OttesenSCG-928-G22]|nr:MBL fold metallo-hydrolase [Christensenellaceae bacterium OttesenSCG-928-M15]MDL2274022.1 MBL fold metallo-hydrolase [Oscillospiraceae bacterium OttesenSCG-928-G22]